MKRFDLLIIDDEKRFADMLAKRLEIRGCSCRVCYSARQGIEMLEQYRFFLVVLDLRLPDMHGAEVLQWIRKACPDTPVIILTGHGSEEDRIECMDKGALDFFNKPLAIDRLLKILEEVREKFA